jgi:hypothetical protein
VGGREGAERAPGTARKEKQHEGGEYCADWQRLSTRVKHFSHIITIHHSGTE